MIATHTKPRVVHGLDLKAYLANPAISASGIRDLRISPLTYWAKSPFNPDRENDESEAMSEGSAYHKRILEGREAFEEAYAPKLDKDDHPDALKSGDELRAYCKLHDLKQSGTNGEMSERIRAYDMTQPLWIYIEAAHGRVHAGCTLLPHKMISRIELAADAIERNPATAALMEGGKPEVSIFWTDEETGVPLKARLDYLGPRGVVDLKTFSNAKGRPLQQAVSYAVADRGYATQAVHYLEAVRVATGEDARFYFVFQETGAAPNVLVREFARDRIYFDIVAQEYRQAINFYAQCLDRWGTDQPWVQSAVIEAFQDEDFPLWAYRS
jgi:PDDEXK-like uncharacterized protein DUF3799